MSFSFSDFPTIFFTAEIRRFSVCFLALLYPQCSNNDNVLVHHIISKGQNANFITSSDFNILFHDWFVSCFTNQSGSFRFNRNSFPVLVGSAAYSSHRPFILPNLIVF